MSSVVLSCAVLRFAQVLSLTKYDMLFTVSKVALKMKWVLARLAPHLHRRNERSGIDIERRDGSDIETDIERERETYRQTNKQQIDKQTDIHIDG
jgi:hypothetical protein